jgi:hypothetical protein
MARDVDPSCNTGANSARVEAECSGSIEGHCLLSLFSKPYLMYSAIDAASAAVDFAKGNVEDGVVNSPPSRDAARLPVCSPSPFQGYGSTPTRQRSYLPTKGTLRTPHRQLYCKATLCGTENVNGVSVGHLQNPARRIHTSPYNVVMQKWEVARFGLNPSLGSLHHHCHRAIWSQWAGMRKQSGVNPTLSRHFFCLVSEVGSGSRFPLELLGRCPIPATTRL